METQTKSTKSARRGSVVLGLLAGFSALALGASACDKLDDIAEEIAKKRDAGASMPAGSCMVDTDCRTFSDYCTGCDCRALSLNTPDPVCGGPGVQCLVDPCLNKTALCSAGRCTIATGESCGKATCWTGTVCCNASCGICTPPGGVCTQQFCG